MKRLNLGAGDVPLEGYENIDIKTGGVIYPLPYQAESVDEIRASHVLEHFPHGEVQAVLADWARALKPGGVMKIAVPDFAAIAQNYLSRKEQPTMGYVMGGQVDENDFHKALFDVEDLEERMRCVGLVAVNRWESETQDCASLPISLNLMGYKRQAWPKVCALMSVPRLGFMDNFFCSISALGPLKIDLKKFTGAFWGQCLERGFEEVMRDESPEFILTLDYDTVYTCQDVEDMIALMVHNPKVDAIAPIQCGRARTKPLFVIKGPDGKAMPQVRSDYFDQALAPVFTAHFGCTLIRASKLWTLPKPWFHSKPDSEGSWNEGREDDDIWFWHRWADAGNSLAIASRIAVGHLEMMVMWPNDHLEPHFQHPSHFWQDGKPAETWR